MASTESQPGSRHTGSKLTFGVICLGMIGGIAEAVFDGVISEWSRESLFPVFERIIGREPDPVIEPIGTELDNPTETLVIPPKPPEPPDPQPPADPPLPHSPFGALDLGTLRSVARAATGKSVDDLAWVLAGDKLLRTLSNALQDLLISTPLQVTYGFAMPDTDEAPLVQVNISHSCSSGPPTRVCEDDCRNMISMAQDWFVRTYRRPMGPPEDGSPRKVDNEGVTGPRYPQRDAAGITNLIEPVTYTGSLAEQGSGARVSATLNHSYETLENRVVGTNESGVMRTFGHNLGFKSVAHHKCKVTFQLDLLGD